MDNQIAPRCGSNIIISNSWPVLAGCATAFFTLAAWPDPAFGYIGPGAGFAFLGSSFVFVLTLLLSLVTFLLWPIQWAARRILGKGIPRDAKTRRIIVLGLDGLEPKLVEHYMSKGKLPHLKKLLESGCYSRLGTTLPALSPVAWSTFQTGVNPGAHNIFDFLTRDKRTCLPHLSSTETTLSSRGLGFGKLKLFMRRAHTQITRKSKPFWEFLGKKGIFCNVIRVPISYPAEKLYGNLLSAMSTPDLRGSQGTFLYYTTRSASCGGQAVGGEVRVFERTGNLLKGVIDGPPDTSGKNGTYVQCPFQVEIRPGSSGAELSVGTVREILRVNEFSPWLQLEFPLSWGKKITGIARFCLREVGEDVSLYVSPVNVDPEKPALPIAYPLFFARWLAKLGGSFGTLGLMEDTWGRNEHALDDQRFLDQAYLTHTERESMFLETLKRTKEGVCVCVFDASDRIQHMFWRYLEDDHPSPREDERFSQVIPDLYDRMDDLVGRTMATLRQEDVFIVLSDHGFSSFRRGINLNTWLQEQGYLTLREGASGHSDYFRDVDWSKTKAFACGLSGIYLNIRGRERGGIVEPADTERLKAEIINKLQELRDPVSGKAGIRRVYDSRKVYRGLYAEEAPDLIIGYEPGYRVSWESVTGCIEPQVFSDNTKAWSGDHQVDPELIPGVFFSNRKLKVDDPHIRDIAPTVLDLFSVSVPPHMEGRVVL